jgi:dinuclear metal center YbgI/SA1388 family protein
MAVNISTVYRIIDEMAPFADAYTWDNSGWLVRVSEITENILVALDVTEDVISQAIEKQCKLVITHHPVMFQGIKTIDTDIQEQKNIIRLIQNSISLISAHTNMDQAQGGINDYLAGRLGLANIQILEEESEPLIKIAVFVPEEYVQKILEAACGVGAGAMGNYSYCTFGASGTGTFFPNEQAHPFCGEPGKLHREKETKLEMLCSAKALDKVIKAIRQSHPYEEPAMDTYTLRYPTRAKGTARIGEMDREYSKEEFAHYVKKALGFDYIRISEGGKGSIRRVAICGGGGGSLIARAQKQGADVYLTGEIKHSDYIWQDKDTMMLIEAGHFDTERCFVDIVFEGLQQRLNAIQCNVNVLKADIVRPYNYV